MSEVSKRFKGLETTYNIIGSVRKVRRHMARRKDG